MGKLAQILIGLVPAVLWALMSLMILAPPRLLDEPAWQVLAAWVGVAGLIWAIVGPAPRWRWVVIGFLAVGVAAMLWRFGAPVLLSLTGSGASGGVSPLSLYFLLGPIAVALFNIVALARARPSNTSLERAGER